MHSQVSSKTIRYTIIAALLISLTTLWTPAKSQTDPTGTMALSTTVNANDTLTPKVTWSTTPAADSCEASGDWSGAKSSQGDETLPAFDASTPKLFALVCQWPGITSALLTWTAPTQNSDGTALPKCASASDTGNCLAKFRVHHGTTSASLPDRREANSPTATSFTWDNLTAGTHFFAISAVAGTGATSTMSNTVSKTTRQTVTWTQQAGIKVPAAPVAGDLE